MWPALAEQGYPTLKVFVSCEHGTFKFSRSKMLLSIQFNCLVMNTAQDNAHKGDRILESVCPALKIEHLTKSVLFQTWPVVSDMSLSLTDSALLRLHGHSVVSFSLLP